MRRSYTGKLFYALVAVLVTALVCVGQSIMDGLQQRSAVQARTMNPESTQEYLLESLLPEQSEQEVLPVTADGEISDFLVPESEHGEDADSQDDDLSSIQPRSFHVSGAPTVFIYHTHTTEAYRQVEGATYQESSEWRTRDNNQNIVAVGETLAAALRAQGFKVIHDTTDHEPPKLATSYLRSLQTMQEARAEHPEIDLFIDVHRDSANEGAQNDVAVVGGERCARMMFVVGTGEGSQKTQYDEKPNWRENYTLAKSITAQLEELKEGLTRPIRVKTGRYNQHVADMCLLVEMGHNQNTLAEAKASARYLATAIAQVINF